jgi:hypothetical protein
MATIAYSAGFMLIWNAKKIFCRLRAKGRLVIQEFLKCSSLTLNQLALM